MRRLREIEDETATHEMRLGEARRALAEEVDDPAEFAARWKEIASTWSFTRVNELIERHNANFPVEARLAMDPRTRDFVRVNGRSYEREPLDAAWILERFPPGATRLDVARAERAHARLDRDLAQAVRALLHGLVDRRLGLRPRS